MLAVRLLGGCLIPMSRQGARSGWKELTGRQSLSTLISKYQNIVLDQCCNIRKKKVYGKGKKMKIRNAPVDRLKLTRALIYLVFFFQNSHFHK